jgi:hypothetical protein
MAYEINIHVDKSGKLITDEFPLTISVFKESRRVKLNFTIDPEVDSDYHYLKFTHKSTNYLYRVHNKSFEIPKAITAWEGTWEMSFVSCDEPASSSNVITANYIYASEPVIATVARGNLGSTITTQEQNLLRELVEGTFTVFEIPNTASFTGEYFLSNYAQAFTLIIPSSVKTIKNRLCYDAGCTKIIFEEGSQLKTLEDYAIYRIANLGDITFPKSIDSWGKYNLGFCGVGIVRFEAVSNLRTLGSHAFWSIPNLTKLYLPDRLQTFSGLTAVIKSCPLLNEIWFPNTITAAIPAIAIQDCLVLNKITLQSNFNASANFSNVPNLTKESMVLMFKALKDLSSGGAKVLTLGPGNLAKCSQADLDIALNKNWSLA